MITTAQEYFANLDILKNINPPAYAILPSAENTYSIDIDSRTINAPEFLSIETDHKSETIYFEVDRFVDYMDLSHTTCVIQYINAKNKSKIYPVPFYDIYTKAGKGKMLFPWCLDAQVAEAAGEVQFSIRFFKIGNILNPNTNKEETVLVYNLNTLAAKSKVLKGIGDYKPEQDVEYLLKAGEFEILQNQITQLGQYNKLYWTILEEEVVEEEVAENEDIEEVINSMN